MEILKQHSTDPVLEVRWPGPAPGSGSQGICLARDSGEGWRCGWVRPTAPLGTTKPFSPPKPALLGQPVLGPEPSPLHPSIPWLLITFRIKSQVPTVTRSL